MIKSKSILNSRYLNLKINLVFQIRGRRDRNRMVVGLTTTYATGAYHHWSCEFELRLGEVYSIQHYVIKFVSDLQ